MSFKEKAALIGFYEKKSPPLLTGIYERDSSLSLRMTTRLISKSDNLCYIEIVRGQMALTAFIYFCFKNYLRQHRYLRELIAMVILSILFGGLVMSDDQDKVWGIFTVFAILLNLLTAPSLFFLEKGNTLHFLLSKPNGRRNLFWSKIILIVLLDLFWVCCFAVLYGLRFFSTTYFVLFPVRLLFIILILLLSTLILSLTFTYRPRLSVYILLVVVLVFGNIVNKAALFPIEASVEIFKLLAFLLPPFFELNRLGATLDFSAWRLLFLGIAFLQIGLLGFFSGKKMMRKDLV